VVCQCSGPLRYVECDSIWSRVLVTSTLPSGVCFLTLQHPAKMSVCTLGLVPRGRSGSKFQAMAASPPTETLNFFMSPRLVILSFTLHLRARHSVTHAQPEHR
jgi:hypothetical protein